MTWKLQTSVDDWLVSTIRLCADHRQSYSPGPPILYETMVLRDADEWPFYEARYCVQATAEADHRRVVAELQAGTDPGDISSGAST